MNKFSGLLDPIQKTLPPDIFTPDKKLHPYVRIELLNKLSNLVPFKNVKEVYLIGSTTGYQWKETSDIDINVVVDPPELADHELNPLVNEQRHSLNGQLLTGTEHPINFFLLPWSGHYQFWDDMVFGVYDILNDKWAAEPGDASTWRDPNEAFYLELKSAKHIENIFLTLVARYFIIKSMVDSLTEDDDPRLIKRYHSRLKQKEEDLLSFVQTADVARKFEYGYGWGIPRRNWRNIVFKVLEASKYNEVFESFKEQNRAESSIDLNKILEGVETHKHINFPSFPIGSYNQVNY